MNTLNQYNTPKAMNWSFNDIYAGVIGMIGGCLAYLKFDILNIDWGNILTGFLQIMWTCFVAFLSAAAGVAGKKIIEKYWFKNKKDK
jgi:hypothetical protein